MSAGLPEARVPYFSIRKTDGVRRHLAILRWRSGRLSLGKIAIAFALVLVAPPVVAATLYYTMLASPQFTSEVRFAVRSSIEAPTLDLDVDGAGGRSGGTLGGNTGAGLSNLGGLSAGGAGASSSSLQDPFVVASFLMSPELTRRLDQDGWLRERYTRSSIDHWSRLAKNASQEELFAFWRRHATAAVDRRANTIQLDVQAFSAEDAQEIASRALALSEKMIDELTARQRDDTLALARAELAEAETRYEANGAKLRQLRRESKIVDPAKEAQAASATLLRLIGERIKARTELETLKRLGGVKAPGLAEIEATINGLNLQIDAANKRLMGNAGSSSVLSSVSALESLELERQFSQGMLNVTTNVFDRARREAEHRASFLLVYLKPTLPVDPSGPNVPVSIAFVAALAAIAWLFATTATAITLDQLD